MSDILTWFQSIGSLLINLIDSIIWFVTNLPGLLMTLTDAITVAPTFLSGFLGLTIAATALFAILRLF